MRRFVEFDFQGKTHREIEPARVRPAIEEGKFVWVDLETGTAAEARALVVQLVPVPAHVVDVVISDGLDTSYATFPGCLHFSVVACRRGAGLLEGSRVDVILGERYLVTVSREPVPFLDSVRREYAEDFVRFAQTPSFLVYELWDHLVRSFEGVQHAFESDIERVSQLFATKVDDSIFAKVSGLLSDLLHFRRHVAPCRAILNELATRKSPLVSETTQRFLGGMVAELDRVLADVTVDREILSESLQLYMSMIGYRTNEVINRLTLVSFVFLPLTFLVGVYGMNFQHIPEFAWKWGYLYFWGLAVAVTGVVFLIISRWRRR